MEQNENIRVAVGILEKNNKILLVQRSTKEGFLNWQFPGGKIEVSENQNNTAEREIFEETGIRCHATHLLGYRIHPLNHVHIYYILCQYISGDGYIKDHNEIKSLRWVKPKELKFYIPEYIYPGILSHFEI